MTQQETSFGTPGPIEELFRYCDRLGSPDSGPARPLFLAYRHLI